MMDQCNIENIKPANTAVSSYLDPVEKSKVFEKNRKDEFNPKKCDVTKEETSSCILNGWMSDFKRFGPDTSSVTDDNCHFGIDNNGSIKKETKHSTLQSFLSEAVASSKTSNDIVAPLIEFPVESTTGDGYKTSNLGELLHLNESSKISSEDLFVAAIADILVMQKRLCEAESKLKELGEKNLSLESENVSLQMSLGRARVELEDMKTINVAVISQKRKLASTLKEKRDLLMVTEGKLSKATEAISLFESEKGTLLQGIRKLSAVRDELKTKLLYKNEISREQRSQVERLEKRLRTTQAARAKELQLLQLYRQLSLHTGYFKWGKQIRAIESEIADDVNCSEA